MLRKLRILDFGIAKLKSEDQVLEKEVTIITTAVDGTVTQKVTKQFVTQVSFTYHFTLELTPNTRSIFDHPIMLRSPESMIFYLGQLIAAQNSKNPYIPQITLGPKPVGSPLFELPLLVVRKGVPDKPVSVSVVHEGDTYYIPRKKRGRSMHALSLVSQILNLQKDSKELPITPTVTLIAQ